MAHQITSTSSPASCDFTVILDAPTLTDVALESLKKNAIPLLKEQEVHDGVNRTVHLFIQNGKTVALIQYKRRPSNAGYFLQECERNCNDLLSHLSSLIGVFETRA